MLNLKELSERYKDVGLGYIHFGGKSYYEVNSDVPLSLNSFGGKGGFVLSVKGEVQLFDASDRVLVKRHYYLTEEWNDEDEVDYETEHFWDETTSNRWWGKTLDDYFPHPWYPEKEIISFELIGNLPFNRKGVIEQVVGEGENSWIELTSPDGAYDFTVSDCLQCPEFFRPLYKY